MLPAPAIPFIPDRINTGPWLAGYTLDVLRERVRTERVVLPICSFGTPPEQLAALAPLVLPPLYHEALDADLKAAVLADVRRCFPFFEGTRARAEFRGRFDVVELPPQRPTPPRERPRVLAFGVDTTVEQHGPHLPLATDTIQSYAVLQQLAAEIPELRLAPALEHGLLTWGLPFGLSIALSAPVLARYVTGFVHALLDWQAPAALYVVDVHGSAPHRDAVQEGLRRSRCARWRFRWIHEPLLEFSAQRGDPHAGGVETALVAHINPALVDGAWWPRRVDELAAHEMTQADALALSADLSRFIARVEGDGLNGIVGTVRAATELDAAEMMRRMIAVAREDVRALLE